MNLHQILTVFVVCFHLFAAATAQNDEVSGSRSAALAGSTVALNDCWSVFGNQAGLAAIDRITVGAGFSNRFLVKELSSGSGFLIFPVHSSVFALSIYQFGEKNFRNEKYGLAFAHRLHPRLQFGLQFNYYRYFMPEENRSLGSVGAELGFQYRISKQFLCGIHSLNPYPIRIKTLAGEINYPSRLKLGAFYQISPAFGLVAEIEKERNHPTGFRTGFEYTVMDVLFIRAGVATHVHQLSAGMGLALQKLRIDLAVAYDQYLGNSPSVSFQYQF